MVLASWTISILVTAVSQVRVAVAGPACMYALASWVYTLTPIPLPKEFGLPYLGVDIGCAVQPGLLPSPESRGSAS